MNKQGVVTFFLFIFLFKATQVKIQYSYTYQFEPLLASSYLGIYEYSLSLVFHYTYGFCNFATKLAPAMKLSELKEGESGVIVKVTGHGGFRKRIVEMGFISGQKVEVLINAPLKDPVKYRIMG